MTIDTDCNIELRVADGLAGMEKLIVIAKATLGDTRATAKVAFSDFALLLGPLVGHGVYFEDLKTRMKAVKV